LEEEKMQQQQEEEAEAVAAADLRVVLPVVAAMVVLAMVGVNAAATWTSHAWTTTGGAMP
jgi:hypothetical protein